MNVKDVCPTFRPCLVEPALPPDDSSTIFASIFHRQSKLIKWFLALYYQILEASNRLQIGVHYKIPYPRLHHKVSNFGHLDCPDMTFGRSQPAAAQWEACVRIRILQGLLLHILDLGLVNIFIDRNCARHPYQTWDSSECWVGKYQFEICLQISGGKQFLHKSDKEKLLME